MLFCLLCCASSVNQDVICSHAFFSGFHQNFKLDILRKKHHIDNLFLSLSEGRVMFPLSSFIHLLVLLFPSVFHHLFFSEVLVLCPYLPVSKYLSHFFNS